jgi:PAS domain S-box-containing protein
MEKDDISLSDISAGQLLRESQANARAIMEATDEVVILLDKEGRVIDCNEAHARRFNMTRAELLGKKVFGLLPPEVAAKRHECVLRALATGKPVYSEDHRGGFWNEFSIHPVYSDGVLTDRVAIFSRDITLRKQVEEALRQREREMATLMDNLKGMVYSCLMDEQWTMKFVSEGAYELTGYRPEELVDNRDLPFVQVIHPDDRLYVWQYIQERWHRREAYDLEYRIISKTGQLKYVWERGQGVPNVEGQLTQLEGFISDISERKRAQEAMKAQEKRLRALNASKDKFFSIIAHDLRSPLNGMLGLTQILAEDASGLTVERMQEIALVLNRSAVNLYRLLDNLLQWARVQNGTIPFHPGYMPLEPQVAACIETFREQARAKNVSVSMEVAPNVSAYADSEMIQVVLRNLLSNAIKFSFSGGSVQVSVRSLPPTLTEISVRDEGIGMAQELCRHLFQMDAQTGRPGTNGEPSTGLGLLLCKEMVDKHGGILQVQSVEGKGSTFSFTLPSAPPEQEQNHS